MNSRETTIEIVCYNRPMSKTLSTVIVLILAVSALAVSRFMPTEISAPRTEKFESVDPTKIDTNNLITVVSTVTLPKPRLALPSLDNNVADSAWNVFENYLKSAQNHDLASLRKYSHQISDTCNNPELEEQCFALMDNVHALGIQFKREEFKNIWFDDKQIIMASDYVTIDDETFGSRGMARMIIYFTRDELGNPKIISFNGLDGNFVLKNDLTNEELDKHLLESIQDDDEDGLPNKVEVCDDESPSVSICTDTDPKRRDTDGDGWWDSTETFFYK